MTTSNTNTIRLHRVIRATPEKVYRAFIDANAMAKWCRQMATRARFIILMRKSVALTRCLLPISALAAATHSVENFLS